MNVDDEAAVLAGTSSPPIGGETLRFSAHADQPSVAAARVNEGLLAALVWARSGEESALARLPVWLDAWLDGEDHWSREEWLAWFESDSGREWVVVAINAQETGIVVTAHVPAWPSPTAALEELICAAGCDEPHLHGYEDRA